ncbi:ankyrin repeat domain-containing protein [Curtobacterium oceanosedimentum]|uniref:ankyrin repeat domain-containing protein n=1 Tax=Curtobacterium oceanosedimentum TaxID=465820 RepID=UPI001CE20D50|nr:ankyrin repeat domain-containing protein [Curtobacterium oceanosedimentum]MCA5922369.1 ankyrin repeat domain-containing protein [Curtobacterium oceanosedimentum]
MRWSRVNWPSVGYVSLEDFDGQRDHVSRLLEDAPPTVAALLTVTWTDARVEGWTVESADAVVDPDDDDATTPVDLPGHGVPDPVVVHADVVVRNDEVLDTPDGLWRRWNHARVSLRLRDAVIDPPGIDPAALLAGDAHVARGELEYVNEHDAWELRLLVSPVGEVAIRFRGVRVSIRSVAESVYAGLGERPARGWHGPVPDGWVEYATEVVRAAAYGDLGGLHLADDASDVDDVDQRWGFAPLHAAAWFDRPEMLEELLRRGASVQLTDTEGRTPLTLAIDRDARRAVDVLVAAGADLEARDGDGNSPIVRAAWGGHAAIVRALADAGADTGVRGSRGVTLLIAAVDSGDVDTVRAVLGLDVDRGAEDDEGSTAADRAALLRETAVADLLAADG